VQFRHCRKETTDGETARLALQMNDKQLVLDFPVSPARPQNAPRPELGGGLVLALPHNH